MASTLSGKIALTTLLITVLLGFDTSLASVTGGADSGCSVRSWPWPHIMLCEDFEEDTFQTRWDIGSQGGTWPISQFVLCADGFGFNDRCAAWSNHLIFDTYWGFWGYDALKAFLPQRAFYVRWYQYISDPYAWGTLEDKSLLLHDSIGSITAYVGTSRNQMPVEPNSGPGMPFVANYQDLDWSETGGQSTLVNRFQNQGNNITLQPGRWYFFEWYIKLNTPGVSNGVTRLWIDDASQPIHRPTLRMQYDDMRWLKTTDAWKRFSLLRLNVYHQRCDSVPNTCPPNGPDVLMQSHRWDRIVISRWRIGPVPPPSVCDQAQANPEILWPPTQKMVPVKVVGATHRPNLVPITIVKVTQDEPVQAGDRPRAWPDAIMWGGHVLLRAERVESGNGRSYAVHFVGRDARGARCTGVVHVGVPRDMTPGFTIVDDGQIYDSTRR